jgi:hypothetical protein
VEGFDCVCDKAFSERVGIMAVAFDDDALQCSIRQLCHRKYQQRQKLMKQIPNEWLRFSPTFSPLLSPSIPVVYSDGIDLKPFTPCPHKPIRFPREMSPRGHCLRQVYRRQIEATGQSAAGW